MVFPRLRKIIEVRGCFWHQHKNCIDSRIPKTRIDYWKPKLTGNVERDVKNVRELRRQGWKVLALWECEVQSAATVRRIERFLESGNPRS